MLVLLGVLGLGTVLFAILTIMFYAQATSAKKTLDQAKAAAAEQAKSDQKKADEAAASLAASLPYRTYTAPGEFGSFEIKFPKQWSSYAIQDRSGTQVNLALNPDFVRRTNGQDEVVAARILLLERTSDQYLAGLGSYISRGTIKKADTTVSGIASVSLTGQFQDKKVIRQVMVPVRDKVIIFQNENSTYASQFNDILSGSKIIP